MKNGSKLHEGAMAWSDAQVQVQGVTHYRLQSGWAPLLRQKGQNILEEVDWDTDWSKDSDRGWDWKGTNGYGGYGPQKQAWRLPAACSVLQTMTFKCTESQNSHDGLEPLKTPDGKAGRGGESHHDDPGAAWCAASGRAGRRCSAAAHHVGAGSADAWHGRRTAAGDAGGAVHGLFRRGGHASSAHAARLPEAGAGWTAAHRRADAGDGPGGRPGIHVGRRQSGSGRQAREVQAARSRHDTAGLASDGGSHNAAAGQSGGVLRGPAGRGPSFQQFLELLSVSVTRAGAGVAAPGRRLQHDECGAAPCLLSARSVRESRPGPRPVNDVGQTGFSARLLGLLQSTAWRTKPACQRSACSATPIPCGEKSRQCLASI
eukprot:s4767_g3.t1